MKEKKKLKLIIWSFWTSDLKIDWDLIREDFYNETKNIAENFEEYKDKISFDMIESFLKENTIESDVIIKWIFTDQYGYKQDTIFLKDIFIKYLKYNKIARFAQNHIILNEARRIEEVKKTIDKEIWNLKQDDFEKIFIVPTWWTKWMVAWFILSALSNLDLNKLFIYYGEEQYDWNKTIWLKQDDVVYSQYSYNIKKLKEHENYKAIIDIIEDNNLQDKFKEEYNIARYFYTRLNADYETAEKIYKDEKLHSWLYISSDTKDILEESINWILYTWRTWRYIEFLWRVYNFTENATRYIINKYFDLNDSLTYEKLTEIANENENLRKFLYNYKFLNNDKYISLEWNYENSKLRKDSYINSKVGIALVEYISKEKKEYKKFVDMFNKIEKLNQYRNTTLIWHGIKPVSKEIIEQKYNWDIEKDFKDFFNTLFWNKKLWIDLSK